MFTGHVMCHVTCHVIIGIVTIWNAQNNKCLLFWKTDCSEIGGCGLMLLLLLC